MQDTEHNRPAGSPLPNPAKKKVTRKGAPPPQDDTLGALDAQPAPRDNKDKDKDKAAKAPAKDRSEPLNFRVTADFRRSFKRSAAAQDCKKVELLERIFAEWSARNTA
ncbi:hypothetical protein [Roseicella aquatilis]|uniref:Uncharacterized protein n=1 Tax=Roseicella aquatilis TaxID=2527868 RepID=A0A4R4D3R8_9PROT|nr:hypothetical protein [Roseicella aquatilis]TCZ51773.1 hypothetical protein EXY23_26750 [Roseicella aquatilis]